MVTPLLVFIGALALYPTVLTAYGAFVHDDALTPPNHFTGFGNFTAVFNNPQVRESLENTGLYVVFGVLLSVALGTFFALLLQRRFRGPRNRAGADGAALGAAGRGRGRDLVLDL